MPTLTPFNWQKFLRNLPLPRVVTLIGGGGKTGLLYFLLNHLQALGMEAVAATTTKMSGLRSQSGFVEVKNLTEAAELLQQRRQRPEPLTLVGGRDSQQPDKMVGIPGAWLDQLATEFPNTFFLIEGDGSAGRSLKGHLAHEPVIPQSTGLVVPVIGFDVLGAPLNSNKVHRPERVTQMTGQPPESTVTIELVLRLLLHPEGYLRRCPPHSQILPFINKVERAAALCQAKQLAAGILASQQAQIKRVVMGSIVRQEFYSLTSKELLNLRENARPSQARRFYDH